MSKKLKSLKGTGVNLQGAAREQFKTETVKEARGQGAMYSGPEQVSALRLVTMLKGLHLEVSTGMKLSRGISCYALAKNEFGLKGNKVKVFEQLAVIVRDHTGVDLTGLTAKLKGTAGAAALVVCIAAGLLQACTAPADPAATVTADAVETVPAVALAPVPQAPSIANRSGTVAEGDALTVTVDAVDPAGLQLTFTCQACPAGATVDPSTGALVWVPGYLQAGAYTFQVSASNGADQSDATYSVTVSDTNRPPVLAIPSAGTVTVGTPVSIRPAATDPDGDAPAVTVLQGPAGATFTAGLFSYTPAAPGTYTVTFRATDAAGATVEGSAVFGASALPNHAPTLSGVQDLAAPALAAYNPDPAAHFDFTVGTADADGDPVTLSTGTLPAGATFNAGTGAFHWVPSCSPTAGIEGAYPVTFTATDAHGAATSATATLTVQHVDCYAPAWLGSAPAAITAYNGAHTRANPGASVTVYAGLVADADYPAVSPTYHLESVIGCDPVGIANPHFHRTYVFSASARTVTVSNYWFTSSINGTTYYNDNQPSAAILYAADADGLRTYRAIVTDGLGRLTNVKTWNAGAGWDNADLTWLCGSLTPWYY